MNHQIRAKEVRVVDESGKQIGIMPIEEARARAEEAGLDLVEIAPNADPPVCKIIDYGKFKYQLSKKAQEARKNQKTTQLKEIKFRPKIDEHDYQFKKNHIIRFLTAGHMVKVTVMFRGREMVHTEMGRRILDRLIVDLEELARVEREPKLEGRNMSMIFAPKKK
ncbi:MAG: translation initiation factor IF-3 [Acidobacteria bacterium]|nr:translation initiation factor IF-3 [Acidobacteriota bacterium]